MEPMQRAKPTPVLLLPYMAEKSPIVLSIRSDPLTLLLGRLSTLNSRFRLPMEITLIPSTLVLLVIPTTLLLRSSSIVPLPILATPSRMLAEPLSLLVRSRGLGAMEAPSRLSITKESSTNPGSMNLGTSIVASSISISLL